MYIHKWILYHSETQNFVAMNYKWNLTKLILYQLCLLALQLSCCCEFRMHEYAWVNPNRPRQIFLSRSNVCDRESQVPFVLKIPCEQPSCYIGI